MVDDILPALIGYIASIIGVSANVPQIVDLLRHPEKRRHQNLPRNILLAESNILWLAYGLLTTAWPVVVNCGIAASMLITITIFVLMDRFGGR
jgi:uncharacterized protein with PQ loop repeat